MSIFESLENLNVSEECFEDIVSIVEEYIHEVSVSTWKKAAISSLPKRAYKAGYAASERDKSVEKEECTDDDIEVSDKAIGHAMRMGHAAEVAKLPDSKMSANKVLKAARKVRADRIKKMKEHRDREFKNGNYFGALEGPAVDRGNHANNLSHANDWTNYLLN